MKIYFPVTLCLCLVLSGHLSGQDNRPRYWISFTDKENSPYSVERPEEFLSQRAIERRTQQNIAITENDLPVNPAYIDSLSNMGLRVINSSKWLNGILVSTNNILLIDSIQEIGFIDGPAIQVKPAMTKDMPESSISRLKNSFEILSAPYGYSSNQIEMLHGDYFHQQGIKGGGMLIAILDAGFDNANAISSLSHVWNENRCIATKDFVKDTLDIFEAHNHGTLVMSIIAGIRENILYGSAPEAEFALVRTEDGSSEYLIEEYNWVCGAEFADSLGADVINSSLGYSLFDDPSQNHTYSDLDGNTAPASIGANIASSKGMVVVCSAGNQGDDLWYHIQSPADADNIITVGAVDSLGILTNFSSRGPSYDRRVKPDVCSQGAYTVGQYPDGSFIYAFGTSCSAPLITGMTACLWQSNRQAKNLEVVEAFHKAADRYFTPDSLYGFGIPDLNKSDHLLANIYGDSANNSSQIDLFPNPAHDYIYLEIHQPEETGIQTISVTIFDAMGRVCKEESMDIESNNFIIDIRELTRLSSGLFILRVNISDKLYSLPFNKL